MAFNEDWTSLPGAEQVLRLEADPRPAWLWSGEGAELIWANDAARLFGAKIKSSGLKLAETAQPIRGQIARILRLGLIGRPTLSRVQFLAGRKPLSATCVCTPLPLGTGKPHMLFVGVDPIADDILALAHDDAEAADTPIEEIEISEAPVVPEAIVEEPEPTEAPSEPAAVEDDEDTSPQRLTALVDRLANDDYLFAPLDDQDEGVFDERRADPVPPLDFASLAHDDSLETGNEDTYSDWGNEDPFAAEEAAFAADIEQDGPARRAGMWQVTGKGLTRADQPSEAADAPETEPQAESDVEAEAEPIESRTRYNFEELSRILTDRVGRDDTDALPTPASPAAPERGALVTMGDEAPVLNRLPLGVLIFRDQDILFANRALVELTGYDSATTLRALGLNSVIPTIDSAEPAGPVTQLQRRDGEKVSVSARLQTVAWRGRSAFMLTARADDTNPLQETDVRRFAGRMAEVTGQIFFETDKIGLLKHVIDHRANPDSALPEKGTSVAALVMGNENRALAHFLTLPARMSGSDRPALALRAKGGGTLTLFAEGRAGVISGYFGMVSAARSTSAKRPSGNLPTAELGRITREVRRPLNTISGFSELIATEAFGPLSNPRYLEYARDIKSAGASIAELADELEEFVRLAEGNLALSPADIELGDVLTECLMRVRSQASTERVLLRSAISERLPLIRADETTLKQAVLNMLASAISEAGEGRKVVLSAQVEEDGAVSIHVRDTAKAPNLLAERFVVFRDGETAEGNVRKSARSSLGLTLTRSLVAVNACSFSLDPAAESGTLMTLTIPPALVVL